MANRPSLIKPKSKLVNIYLGMVSYLFLRKGVSLNNIHVSECIHIKVTIRWQAQLFANKFSDIIVPTIGVSNKHPFVSVIHL